MVMITEKGFSVSGYTLIEVLVSLIIIGISFSALFGGLSKSKTISLKSDQMIEARRILANLSKNGPFMDECLENEEYSGDVPGEKEWEYTFESKRLELDIEAGNNPEEIEIPGMYDCKLCIEYKDGFTSRQYCIKTWRNR